MSVLTTVVVFVVAIVEKTTVLLSKTRTDMLRNVESCSKSYNGVVESYTALYS